MITIKKTAAQQAAKKVLTVEELVAGIGDSLGQTSGAVSGDRAESVASHLRASMRTLGYKPRESADSAGKVTTTIPELHKQLAACIADVGEITEAQHTHLHLHLTATHSNCAAEVGSKAAPTLKEAPLPATAAPQQQQQQTQTNPEGNALMVRKFPELVKMVEDINADPACTEKIELPNGGTGMTKLAVVNLILKAKGLPTLVLLFFLGLFLSLVPSARADLQSFQFTNILPSALAITSWPTNTQTTNYWSAGTNSATGQTNQYLLNWLTGTGIDVRNYNTVGFVFNANITSSNLAQLSFFVVKASIAASGAKPQVVYTNSTFWENDWETTTPAYDQINIPIPAGTNYAFCWRTNLDVTGCDYVGIYQETNNISFGSDGQSLGWTSNNIVGVNKKIIPFSLSGGNL